MTDTGDIRAKRSERRQATNRRNAKVSAVILALTLAAPLLFSMVDKEGYGSLVLLLISWGIVAPVLALITITSAAIATAQAIRLNKNEPKHGYVRFGLWCATLAIQMVLIWSQFPSLTPLFLPIVIAAVILPTFITVIVLAILLFGRAKQEEPSETALASSSDSPQGSRSRSRSVRILIIALTAAAALVVTILLMAQLTRVTEYRSNMKHVAAMAKIQAERELDTEMNLATACLSVEEAYTTLDLLDRLVTDALAVGFDEIQTAAFAPATADSRTRLNNIDPTQCAEEASELSAALIASGHDPKSYSWLDSYAVDEAYADAGLLPQQGAPKPLGFFQVTSQAAVDARELSGSAVARMQSANEPLRESEVLLYSVHDAVFDVLRAPGLQFAAEAPEAADRLIMATPGLSEQEIEQLRELATTLAETGTGAFIDRLSAYVGYALSITDH